MEDDVMIDGRGSQLDPVRVLQGIFKKQEPKRRRPGVNRIAEKYKKVLKIQGATFRIKIPCQTFIIKYRMQRKVN